MRAQTLEGGGEILLQQQQQLCSESARKRLLSRKSFWQIYPVRPQTAAAAYPTQVCLCVMCTDSNCVYERKKHSEEVHTEQVFWFNNICIVASAEKKHMSFLSSVLSLYLCLDMKSPKPRACSFYRKV